MSTGNWRAQTNVSFAQDYGTLPLYFGTSGQTYWDGKLKGTLDEVSLYNRALSSNEVAAIYAAGAAGNAKGPALRFSPRARRWWRVLTRSLRSPPRVWDR